MQGLRTQFSPFPQLTSARITLSNVTHNDAPFIYALRTNTVVNKYIGRAPYESLESAEQFIQKIQSGIEEGQNIFWGIRLIEHNALIGTICFWNFSMQDAEVEIGYELLPQHHGNGYMSEAITLALEYAKESMHAKRVCAFTHKDNQASKHLLERNGFKHMFEKKDSDVPTNVVYQIDL